MEKEEFLSFHEEQKHSTLTKYEYHINIIRNELMKCRTIKIPFQSISINHEELADWIVEELSPNELDEIIHMVRNAKKRSSSVKPLFQVIAAGLIKK
ncbi:MAG: hypothetical protein ABF649_06805 [Bacillus sp. (in: firmicutes)]